MYNDPYQTKEKRRVKLYLLSILRLLPYTKIPSLTIRLMLDKRVSLRSKLIIPVALIYFFSPIDLIPDIILPFGRIDDIICLVLAPIFFICTCPLDVVKEYIGGNKKQGKKDSVLEADYRHVENTSEEKEK
ncbi:MAG: hypothetical protein CL904_00670 [Dehalococcoidia bacterium]|nr:hypothetical protein [Dehalococcoidia bacterium]